MSISLQRAIILQQIANNEQQFARKPNSVLLLAVSKGQSPKKIQEAYLSGQRHFGENYLQEALTKQVSCSEKDIIWHFIGKIQSNKTQRIANHFEWVHSLDNEKIAQRLNDQRLSENPLNICIAVNIDGSSTKSGLNIDKVHDFAIFCQQLPKLRLRGLMLLPTPQPTFAAQRHNFHLAHTLFTELNKTLLTLDTLSMGMSADFPAAIAEGSTIIRIGSALFGQRLI